jgi:uncharacterized membrane protein YphA (DoxX/SURF4 family)
MTDTTVSSQISISNMPCESVAARPRRQPVKAGITRSNTADFISNRARDYITVFLRLALGISLLSAVADRFGLWRAYGQPNVAWGDFSRFITYTGKLNWFVPTAVTPVSAWAATFVETWLGLALVLGF